MAVTATMTTPSWTWETIRAAATELPMATA
jgi:hypothetical protein